MHTPVKTSLQSQGVGHLPFGEHETLHLVMCVVTSGWSNEKYTKGMGQKTALAVGRRSDHFNCNQYVIFTSLIYKTRSTACSAMCAWGHNIEICRESFTVVRAAI